MPSELLSASLVLNPRLSGSLLGSGSQNIAENLELVSAFWFLRVLSEITVVSLLHLEALGENMSSNDSAIKLLPLLLPGKTPGEVSKTLVCLRGCARTQHTLLYRQRAR